MYIYPPHSCNTSIIFENRRMAVQAPPRNNLGDDPFTIDLESRSKIVAWLIEVYKQDKSSPLCLHLALYLFDNFVRLERLPLQLYALAGIASFNLAVKYEVGRAGVLKPGQLEKHFCLKEYYEMEQRILIRMDFSLTNKTAYEALFMATSKLSISPRIGALAERLLLHEVLNSPNISAERPEQCLQGILLVAAQCCGADDHTRQAILQLFPPDFEAAPVRQPTSKKRRRAMLY